jgi:CheY-like chemotaxis protein
VGLRCLLVDDSTQFLGVASKVLEGQGFAVSCASTSGEALARVRELDPDVAIVDVNLKGESGFDLAWELASTSEGTPTRTILTSTRSESDLADLVAVTPVLGFIPKDNLSGGAVEDFLADRSHGHGCRHEALFCSSADELSAGVLPFIRRGLERGEDVLVVLKEAGLTAVRRALGADAAEVDFRDAVAWYRSPEHAFEQYSRYAEDHIESGAPRVRIAAQVVWPESSARAAVAGWTRYEAGISVGLATVPVSFICAYDTSELPPGIVADARRTHPVVRTAEGAHPSAHYAPPSTFVRALERDVPELMRSR